MPPVQECPIQKPRVLFIDRDGTIIREPDDEQIDTLDKVEFLPHVFSALRSIAALPYLPMLVSNQDGLGTPSHPAEAFWPLHRLIIRAIAAEGFRFAAEHIDPTMPDEHAPTRKPGTAMLTAYMQGDYDLENSYVIGDRATDVQLACNLGCKAILIQTPEAAERLLTAEQKGALALATDNWLDIAEFLRRTVRRTEVSRRTAETDVHIIVDLDGGGETHIDTGLKFYDHMLLQLPHHAGISLVATCRGDLNVDEHHTMEDVAICLGEALRRALGDKRGIDRYGFVLPMDESRAFCLIDFGGRTDFEWDVQFTREYIGDTPTEMFRHVFASLCAAMQANLHIAACGENNHHLAESIFKAFARALRQAIRRNVFSYELPSTKGVL